MPTLVDTDILSRFFRNDARVVSHFDAYCREQGVICLSIITWYEIVSGLMHKDAHRQLERFLAFADQNRVLPLTQTAANHAARLYAITRQAGTPVDDIDLLIAGIALAHGMSLATHNVSHFNRLPGLIVEDWAA